MSPEEIIFAVDAHNRWHVFDRRTALGSFATWAEAAELRDQLTTETRPDDAPAWTPVSGGY